MAMDRKELTELYKIAREAQHHADTINMQIYMALGVVMSLFLVAIGFIFSPDFPLRREYVIYPFLVKVGILLAFGFTECVFYRSFRLRAQDFQKWAEVIKKTADKLPTETNEGLLIREDPSKTADEDKKRLRWYKLFFIVVFIALGLLLFIFIE